MPERLRMKKDQIQTKAKPMTYAEQKAERERQWRRLNRRENLKLVGGCLLLIAVVIAVLFLFKFLVDQTTVPKPNWGTVTDKGAYAPGKYSMKYVYWVDVVADTGERMTWDVSDTFYQSVEVGDYVRRPGTEEEDSRIPDI